MPLEPPTATPGRPITAPDQALDRMVAAVDRCLAELTARPPWW